MPGTKEIRSKIASVKSTQKITKAMQMLATSKMRRAQERMRLARPYAQKMRNVIGHLTEAKDMKSTRLNSSHLVISDAVFCLQKKNTQNQPHSHGTHDLQGLFR